MTPIEATVDLPHFSESSEVDNSYELFRRAMFRPLEPDTRLNMADGIILNTSRGVTIENGVSVYALLELTPVTKRGMIQFGIGRAVQDACGVNLAFMRVKGELVVEAISLRGETIQVSNLGFCDTDENSTIHDSTRHALGAIMVAGSKQKVVDRSIYEQLEQEGYILADHLEEGIRVRYVVLPGKKARELDLRTDAQDHILYPFDQFQIEKYLQAHPENTAQLNNMYTFSLNDSF